MVVVVVVVGGGGGGGSGAMVAQSLWEWPTNVCFNLRPNPGEGVDTLHCLKGQELETGYPRDLG